MARTVAIGVQDFEKIILNDRFYIDKTLFIKDWWDSGDEVTLITRPRRFGKTLNMTMLERFFSNKYQNQGKLFEKMNIWKEEDYRELQGTYPVIFLSFAGVKADNYSDAREQIFQIITNLYSEYQYLRDSEHFDRESFERVKRNMSNMDAVLALQNLCRYLYRYYEKKVLIFLDEYDTPLQEAYVNGYWEELVVFIRNLFNNTFKTNPYLERAVMTGITRISKESMFSDLNNLNVVTITSREYASYFGFTETEVFLAMDEFGISNKEEVKRWYDGFTIGNLNDIYNPWSIINFLDKQELKTFWANTSSNSLISSLLQKASKNIKMQFEDLLNHRSIISEMDEEIIFHQLDSDEMSIWSLLLASGYIKIVQYNEDTEQYELVLTNYEVERMFSRMIKTWFRQDSTNYNNFIQSLLKADMESMNEYMEQVAESMFSSFDGGMHPSARTTPERFYHGFVLGLLVDLKGRYEILSNRESGFGRYDVMLRPLNDTDDAIILEFKIYNPKKERDLEETVTNALQQIVDKRYEQVLWDQGIGKERIRKYGFAFRGKEVLIG